MRAGRIHPGFGNANEGDRPTIATETIEIAKRLVTFADMLL